MLVFVILQCMKSDRFEWFVLIVYTLNDIFINRAFTDISIAKTPTHRERTINLRIHMCFADNRITYINNITSTMGNREIVFLTIGLIIKSAPELNSCQFNTVTNSIELA